MRVYLWLHIAPHFVPVRWFFIFFSFFSDQVYLLLKVAFINNEFYGAFFSLFFQHLCFANRYSSSLGVLGRFFSHSKKNGLPSTNLSSFFSKILPYICFVVSCFVVAFFFSQLPLLEFADRWVKLETFYTHRSFWYFLYFFDCLLCISRQIFGCNFLWLFFLCGFFECLILLTFCAVLYTKDTDSFA